ncbi:MAG TPA: hypothetical protein VGR07_07015 [Thermoanaerobaculia bacterium]|nr:hypothetical protein [Thermoanaerobaculia bacterium]
MRPRREGRAIGVELLELRNKVSTYYRVRVGAVRRLGRAPLAGRIAAALAGDPAQSAFDVERLALEFARRALVREGRPRGLLLEGEATRLPEESLILAHAGMGLAFALERLAPLRPTSPAAAFDAVLGELLDLYEANSQLAYLPVPQETLGLAVRLFLPRLRGPVDAGLRRIAPDLTCLFWHGAGRGVYFRPAQFLPGGLARAVDLCRREPPLATERLDALAGLSFAVAMVNLHHPRAFARLLPQVADGSAEAEALTHGVIACLLARHHTTPADPAIPAFLAYRPADLRWRESWERRVSEPGAHALTRLYPALREHRRLGDFARFQPLR